MKAARRCRARWWRSGIATPPASTSIRTIPATRLVAGDSGLVELRTIKPGAYPVPDSGGWWRPPHVHFSVWGRIWLSRLVTQMFFPGEPLNERDAVLNAIREPEARARCIAHLAPTAK